MNLMSLIWWRQQRPVIIPEDERQAAAARDRERAKLELERAEAQLARSSTSSLIAEVTRMMNGGRT